MISVLSPAKSLDFDKPTQLNNYTIPEYLEQSEQLIAKLRTLSRKKIGALMSISPSLAALNHERYSNWNLPFDVANAKPAAAVFNGDVYRGLDAASFSEADWGYAQEHLRILSGLHGLLRPLDLIQPYRLEMGTRLSVRRKKNLYEFWGDKVTDSINETFASQDEKVLLNLASIEYFKVIRPNKVAGRIVSANFREFKNGEYKTIMTFAKQARGLMASYIIKNRIEKVEDIKGFDVAGYSFNDRFSTGDDWIFTRDKF